MSEFNELFDEDFFILDSNNLNKFKTNFFGYSIINNEIVFKESLINENELKGYGAYLFISSDNDYIHISQDFNGSYGLYFYKNDDYFAISNSFFKLAEYLKHANHTLSLNQEYSNAFLFADLCSYAYGETLVNEIELLPKNFKVIINKTNKEVYFEEIDYKNKSINIDSKEALDIVDSWYFRWVELIRSLKKETNNITIDLSGGLDSRIIATIWLTANIDLNKVRIKSIDDNLHVHKEDYSIASNIANEFNFKLNNSSFSFHKQYFKDIMTPMNISFYTKLGFHNQMYFKFSRNSEPFYTITGEGGESLRGYPNKTPEEYLEEVDSYCSFESSLIDSTNSVVKRAWSLIEKKFNIGENSKNLPAIHYNEVRSRHHFGKAAVESFLSNTITLTPLLDPELYKINFNIESCEDSNLLFALIYTRYCPELLNFRIEGNREIDESTIEFAKKINEKFPFNPRNYEFISGPSTNKTLQKDLSNLTKDDLEEKFKSIFYSNLFETEFNKIFSTLSYNKISEYIETKTFHPLRHVYTAISIIFMNNLITMNKNMNELFMLYSESNEKYSLIPKSIEFKLLKYNAIRIDIKSYGKNNEVKLIECSDIHSEILNPDWFKRKKGEGLILKSFSGEINFKIKCINSKKLKIKFRTLDIKDNNGNKYPIYVDYEKIDINNDTILDENKLIWHDIPFIYEKDLDNNNELINIYVKWKPFSVNSTYKNIFKEDNEKLKKENKKLKEENKKLKHKLKEVFDSNSWKLTSIFRRK